MTHTHISIHIEGANAAEVRRQMTELLGGTAIAMTNSGAVMAASAAATAEAFEDAAPLAPADAADAPKRERGKPAAGRARRTKEEIAEDEAADKADAAAQTEEQTKPQISTGDERIDPTTAEDAAQDAADEAAEAEATQSATLAHDDVRASLQRYVKAFGMPAAMVDGPKVFKMLFGEAVGKVSEVPDTQEALARAIAGIDEMLAKNPFNREADL